MQLQGVGSITASLPFLFLLHPPCADPAEALPASGFHRLYHPLPDGCSRGPSLTSALRRHGQSLSADVLHVKASFRSPTLASGSVPHLVSQDQVFRQQAHHALSVPRALLLHYSCSSKNDSCWGNHAASLPRPDLGLSLHGWSGLPGSFSHPFIYLLTHQLHRGSRGPGLSPTLETGTHTGWTLRLTESTGSVREAGLISSGAVLRVFWCTGK